MKTVIKKLSNFLYGKEPFELVFDVPPKDAARRLSSHVQKTSFLDVESERMVGNVSVMTGIRIRRVIPCFRTLSNLVMVGTFTAEEGKTKLTGIFRLHLSLQFFMTFWLGMMALFSLESFIKIITTPSTVSASFWLDPLMFCFGVGLVKISKWFAINDKQWLIEKVKSAIDENR